MILPEERIELKTEIYKSTLAMLHPGKAPEEPSVNFGCSTNEEYEKEWNDYRCIYAKWAGKNEAYQKALSSFRADLKSEDVWAGEAH